MKKVFISSTSIDLKEYRQAAYDVCKESNLESIRMEDFPAMSDNATDGSKEMLNEADLYIGIFAHRYGHIDKRYGLSVTELEYHHAGERGLSRLCFMIDPNYDWPPEYKDVENRDKLEAFKQKVDKDLIRAQFTSVDDFKSKLTTSLERWMKLQPNQPLVNTLIQIANPDDLIDKPLQFFGHDTLRDEVRTLLDQHEKVLLQGFAGVGKTAFASSLASDWITSSKGEVLWLKTGNADRDTLLEAFARHFKIQDEIASLNEDAKLKTLRDNLRESNATLLILDDCWNGSALSTLLKAIPSSMAVLITARQRFPLNQIRTIDEMATADAIKLLKHHANSEHLERSKSEDDLCHLLGNLPFALEIAGKTLKVHNWTPSELIQRIKDAPHNLPMPLDFATHGRENIANLLEVSLNALDSTTRSIFMAFGAFFVPQLTPEMLHIYLSQSINERSTIIEGLETLFLHGLNKRINATYDRNVAYRIHDLAYSYARGNTTIGQRRYASETCLKYLLRHNLNTPANHDVISLEIDNLLAATTWSFEDKDYESVNHFAWNLVRGSEFLVYKGQYQKAGLLLAQAADAAFNIGNISDQGIHLGNLGIAYRHMGLFQKAIDCHEQSLAISQKLGDKKSEAKQLGNLALAYRYQGNFARAKKCHKQSLILSRQIGDRETEANQLGNLGILHLEREEYKRAIKYFEEALEIDKSLGTKGLTGQIASYLSLGTLYINIGKTELAIDNLNKALALSNEIGNITATATILYQLGRIHEENLQELPTALSFYLQAKQLIDTSEVDKHLRNKYSQAVMGVQKKLNKDTDILD